SRGRSAYIKADLPSRCFRRRHQLANGFHNRSDVLIVLSDGLRGLPKFLCEFAIRVVPLAETHKCAREGNVDGYGPIAVQHAGEHRDSLFREGVRAMTSATRSF